MLGNKHRVKSPALYVAEISQIWLITHGSVVEFKCFHKVCHTFVLGKSVSMWIMEGLTQDLGILDNNCFLLNALLRHVT